jgi:hypothetical protein
MEEQHKPEQQLRMDLNIDPQSTMIGNWYTLKRKFQSLGLRDQADVIKLFNMYLDARGRKFSDMVIKIRDGRVVDNEVFTVTRRAA